MDVKAVNRRVIEQYRAGGEIEGMHRDRLLVIASNAGAPADPDWYRNLAARPAVTVEIGAESYEATATPLTGDDRTRAWAAIKEAYPFFADHEAKAGREIPVVELARERDAS